jgi:transcriptional regulator GlxA family with amidase domain
MGSIPPMHIALLVVDGAFDLGLSALLDTLGTANDLDESRPFRVDVVGVRRRVRTGHGLVVPTVRADSVERPDVVLVPAMACKTPATLVAALDRPDVADAVQTLTAWSAAGARVGAACTGTFVLAETGLLDGSHATTTWWLAPLFRERYPRVNLDDGQMVVPSGGFVTAGAALAHLDLALWLIRQSRPELAALAARYLVIDPRPSQATFAIPDHLQHADPIVQRFERWVRDHLVRPFSLADVARGIGTSERTLERRVRTVLGTSPVAFVQNVRVERALHLLRTSDATVDTIAMQVGYRDATTLRTLLRRKTGRGVREIRTGR